MSWVEVKAGQYNLRDDRDKISHAQIELNCSCHALTAFPAEGDWGKIAPLRVLSFDLECAGRKGIFPEAEIDPVIQIANVVTRQGEPVFSSRQDSRASLTIAMQARANLLSRTSSPWKLARPLPALTSCRSRTSDKCCPPGATLSARWTQTS